MKYLTAIFLFLFVFTSCKSNKTLINTNAIAKKMSAKKIIRKHIATNFSKKNVEAKFKATYKSKQNSVRFTLHMKLIKNKVIWLKGSKLITFFKAKITPNGFSYYSPVKKNYFKGDFSMLTDILGTEITFKQLQNLLLGQALINLKKEKQKVVIDNNLYCLSPKKQAELFDLFFYINPNHFKIEKQLIKTTKEQKQLEVFYPKYVIKEKVIFPDKIEIKTNSKNKETKLILNTKSVYFNRNINIHFKIPNSYKSIKI